MDRRFLTALLLTAIVVIATPWIFPSRKAARPVPPAVDTTTRRAPAAPDTMAAVGTRTPTPSPTTSATTPATLAAPREAGDTTAAAQVAARPDTATVDTPVAIYRVSSLGAAPVSVTLTKYKALGSRTGSVELVRPGESLLHYSLILGGDTISLARTPFALQRAVDAKGHPTLSYAATVRDAKVVIDYAFVPDSYLVRARGTVTSLTGGTPNGFAVVTLPSGIHSSEADSVDDQRHLAYAFKPQREGARSIAFGKVDPGERQIVQGPLTWIAAKSKYFIVGLLTPAGDTPFAELQVTGAPRTSKIVSHAAAVAVEPIANGSFQFELYTGPQEWERLLAIGRDFENSNPYGGFLQGVVQPFATIVMRILLWMKRTLQLNYGWVLIIFGITVRLLLWPLNQSAMRTNIKMQRVQPQLQELQKRYKSDPQKLQSEMMRVYKEHGMSPFSAFSGCLPMLLPMPILFALFFVFQNTIEFRGVPFLWLTDISLKDPFYILPLLMGVSMFVLSWIGMRNSPPNPQAKMMSYFFPVIMTFVLLNLAAGLNLYYAIQNLAALPQQWLLATERAKTARSG
jgi:YidC/Oxa1 family membrane protein insertase